MSTDTRALPVVLVAGPVDEAALARLEPHAEVRQVDGTDRDALLRSARPAAALLIGTEVAVDDGVLSAAPGLRVVARAMGGVDGIDVAAATRAGVMIVDVPGAHVTSAAELAVALLLAVSRNLAPASAAVRRGEWTPASYAGVELAGKTAGIIGLGRVGEQVARRLAAFDMTVIAHDPYVRAGRAAGLGVRLVGLEELFDQADFISVHLPTTPETAGLVGAELLGRARSGSVLVNTASGGVVEESALLVALREGRLRGAACDVFAQEPPEDSPLLDLENFLPTPHLGASTGEARARAAAAAVRAVGLALTGQPVPDAVNVRGGEVAGDVLPVLPLVERLGRILAATAEGPVQSLTVEVLGEITRNDVRVLESAALTGLLGLHDVGGVNYVNAPLLAAERGIEARLVADPECPDHRSLLRLTGARPDKDSVSVAGTLAGLALQERLVEVNGFSVDVELSEHLAFMRYPDRPGMVGLIGRVLGEAGVNIAGMQVSRDRRGGEALVVLSVDSRIDHRAAAQIAAAVGTEHVHTVDLARPAH